ncbi:MAG: tetratricopeptide repeat protein [Deltaproteobacteria bacterium]
MAQDRDRTEQADSHNERGIELADRGWLEEAEKEFRKAIALDPGSCHPHENLAMVHVRRKEWREALLAHLKAVEVEPGSAGARFTLGSFLATHAMEMAEAEYRGAITIDPEHAESHLELGLALADLGRPEEGLREMEAAVRLAPEDPVPRQELAGLLMDEGDYRTAIGHLREASRLSPDGFEVHLDLGLCYAQKGFYEEAERAYEKARALQPDDAVVNYDLAALYARWDRSSEVLPALRKALQADREKVKGWIGSDPVFDTLRGSDAFEELVSG